MIKQPAAPVRQVLNYEHCITARVDTLLTDPYCSEYAERRRKRCVACIIFFPPRSWPTRRLILDAGAIRAHL